MAIRSSTGPRGSDETFNESLRVGGCSYYSAHLVGV